MITKIAFVAHPTKDLAAARRFFGEVLGLPNTSNYADKWAEFDTPDGKTIALDSFSPPGQGTYLALETDDIEAELARLRGLGVPVLFGVMDNKVCKMAMVADPAGHGIMLHQMAPDRIAALRAVRTKAKAAPKKPRLAAKRPAKKRRPVAAKARVQRPAAATRAKKKVARPRRRA